MRIGLIICCAVCCGCVATAVDVAPKQHGATRTEPRFALYLVKTPHADMAHTGLESEPLLTEKDLVSYDWPTHTLTLTGAGAKQVAALNTTVGSLGKEWIIVADGQRCYRGALWCRFSSAGYRQPIIDVSASGPAVRIQRAYPTDEFATGVDPRPDTRIRQVLEALGKLKNKRLCGSANVVSPRH